MVKSLYHSRKSFFGINKRGQFFILTAVILASLIVGLATIRNSVTTTDAPKKFYYYSQQLEGETGAVVDYALYTGNTSDLLTEFLQSGITNTQSAYPDLEIYACFTDPENNNQLICQNNGTTQIVIWNGSTRNEINASRATILASVSGGQSIEGAICDVDGLCYLGTDLYEGNYTCENVNVGDACITPVVNILGSVGCSGSCSANVGISQVSNITVTTSNGNNYTLSVINPQVQSKQFYFIFKINTSSGEYVDVSGDGKTGQTGA